jgi:hypothetical protein
MSKNMPQTPYTFKLLKVSKLKLNRQQQMEKLKRMALLPRLLNKFRQKSLKRKMMMMMMN